MGACALLSGCYKDAIEPSDAPSGTLLEVRFSPHVDGKPYHPDSSMTDGFGTRVRMTRCRFALVGVTLLSDEGRPMGEWPDRTLPFELNGAAAPVRLEAPSSGEVHWMDTRPLAATDDTAGLSGWWTPDAGGGSLAAVDIGGIYDSNGNGSIDGEDGTFRITTACGPATAPLRIHAHCVVPAHAPGTMELAVDLPALLHNIDLPDEPITIGSGTYATQLMDNLRTRVLGDDNKPL